ncbi:MAG: 30S ribosomal protein S7 [Patescibacteria group bacterium]|nr:30S ribosomal protein S7 [Patescibacteria group bacterium]
MSRTFTRRYDANTTANASPFSESQLKFINMLMKEGKKSIARHIFEKMRDLIMEQKLEKDFNVLFDQAIYNASPIMEVRSKRVAGSAYQVPFEVKENRRRTLAMRWIINSARKKTGAMYKLLSAELVSAYKNEGDAVKKKEEVHRMAEANRAFAHFAKY